jgi:putative transposase
MSVERRRAMIDPTHPHLSVVRQCGLVSIGRSAFYRASTPATAENLLLMRLLDEQFLETPWYGSRRWRGTCVVRVMRSDASGPGG